MATMKWTTMLAAFCGAMCIATSLHAGPFQMEQGYLQAQAAIKPSFKKIDKGWPAMKQYVAAVQNLKPSVSENMAVIALLTSSFVARDIGGDVWLGDVKTCILSPGGEEKNVSCASAHAAIEGKYKGLVTAEVKPVITNPALYDSNAYILATIAVDELNFQMDTMGIENPNIEFIEARLKKLEKELAESQGSSGFFGGAVWEIRGAGRTICQKEEDHEEAFESGQGGDDGPGGDGDDDRGGDCE